MQDHDNYSQPNEDYFLFIDKLMILSDKIKNSLETFICEVEQNMPSVDRAMENNCYKSVEEGDFKTVDKIIQSFNQFEAFKEKGEKWKCGSCGYKENHAEFTDCEVCGRFKGYFDDDEEEDYEEYDDEEEGWDEEEEEEY